VVGGRGVGKSFWASVLANTEARSAASKAFPSLGLERYEVYLGFHEGAAGTGDVAPSRDSLRAALACVRDPLLIWRSVLLRALAKDVGPLKLSDRAQWIDQDPERYEDLILEADRERTATRRPALVVFDALDVLATDWNSIRDLTRGLARLALEVGALRSVRLKLFMRRDQFEDLRLRSFPDFSKLRTAAVELTWMWVDLYGVLFTRLLRDSKSRPSLRDLASTEGLSLPAEPAQEREDWKLNLPEHLQTDTRNQQALFSAMAGEYMGATEKRGRTYSWVPKHLADAHGETSLRSFLIALREAAGQARGDTVVDAAGLSHGVLRASDTRLEELQEDNPWVENALKVLSGLTVPCDPLDLTDRWRTAGTIAEIQSRTSEDRPAAPIQLETVRGPDAETALLNALRSLAVIELRPGGRVNVPDIFRVAARMKRKGGIAPRKGT
jgi:hypothetical protein